MTFTQNELIRALQDAQRVEGDTPNSITSTELQEAHGIGVSKARRLIRQAIADGLVRPEGVYRTNMAGIRQRVMGYVLVDK